MGGARKPMIEGRSERKISGTGSREERDDLVVRVLGVGA